MKPSKKKILKSIIKEIKEILYDSILDRDEKIEEIKKTLYNPKNNLFKLKEDNYKPIRIGNGFSSNYIEYKSNGDEDKTLSIKDYLDEIKPYLSDIINDHMHVIFKGKGTIVQNDNDTIAGGPIVNIYIVYKTSPKTTNWLILFLKIVYLMQLKYKFLKFYQFLILLSGNISLNPGPNQDLHDIEDKFQPFWKRGLHFLHININSLLSKIDKLRDIIGHTKPAILGITESKLDGSVTNQEVNTSGYSILRNDRNRNGGGVACYIRSDLCFNSRNIFSNSIEHIFFDLLIPKMKPISIGIFYRPPNANNCLESFINDLKHIDF